MEQIVERSSERAVTDLLRRKRDGTAVQALENIKSYIRVRSCTNDHPTNHPLRDNLLLALGELKVSPLVQLGKDFEPRQTELVIQVTVDRSETLLSINRRVRSVLLLREVDDRDRNIDNEALDKLACLYVVPDILPLIYGIQNEIPTCDQGDEFAYGAVVPLRDELSVRWRDCQPRPRIGCLFLSFGLLDLERITLE